MSVSLLTLSTWHARLGALEGKVDVCLAAVNVRVRAVACLVGGRLGRERNLRVWQS